MFWSHLFTPDRSSNEEQESTNIVERVVVIGEHEDPGTCYAQLVDFVYHLLTSQNTIPARAKALLILVHNQPCGSGQI